MDQEVSISIIVPVYKVEAYLRKCVDSILAQTYTNLEIILVDDGSPDNCPQMCDEYKALDSRIVVIHQQNGGLSAARNAGLDIATGSYIMFVDSDDYIAPDMCEKLYQLLIRDGSDLAICSLECIYEPGCGMSSDETVKKGLKSELLTTQQALEKVCESWFFVVAWNKLYKKDLFAHYRFPVGRIHEDEFAVHHIFAQCQRISVTEERLYYYLRRADSITGQQKELTVKRLDAIDALMDRYQMFNELGYMDLYKSTLLTAYWILYDFLARIHDKSLKKAAKAYVSMLFHELIRNGEWKSALRLLLHYAGILKYLQAFKRKLMKGEQ